MTRLQSFEGRGADKRELNDRVNLPRMFKAGVPWQDSSPLRFVSMNFKFSQSLSGFLNPLPISRCREGICEELHLAMLKFC